MKVGKGRTYSRGHKKDAEEATRGLLATAKRGRVVGRGQVRGKTRRGRAHVWDAKMDGVHAPLFVTIYKSWRHSADVRAGANKQENDEK